MQFWKPLKQLREEAKLTQREMADLFGVTTTHYSNVENGRSNFPVSWIPATADLFSLNKDEFVNELISIEGMNLATQVERMKLDAETQRRIKQLRKLSLQRKHEDQPHV